MTTSDDQRAMDGGEGPRRMEELEERHRAYRAVLASAMDAVLISDFETATFVEANPASCEMFGYSREEFFRLKGRDLSPPDVYVEVQGISKQLVTTGRAAHRDLKLVRKDGSTFWGDARMATFEVAGRTQYVTIIRDVTERVDRERELRASYEALKAAQATLVRVSRLSAVGQLGAGIAHELNQPLTAIRGFSERIQRKPDERVREHLDALSIISSEAGRMARIVDNVRTFARNTPAFMGPIEPSQPVDDALMLLQSQVRDHGIELVRDVAEDLPRMRGDSQKLQQVFINLIANARDALEDRPSPRRIEVRVRVSPDGDQIVYEVWNSGFTVDDAVHPRLFDPFFTTKPPGRGTGLGLSIAYGIVTDHAGSIRCDRASGEGTAFVVEIPVWREEQPRE